jgi:hypothetical protein
MVIKEKGNTSKLNHFMVQLNFDNELETHNASLDSANNGIT